MENLRGSTSLVAISQFPWFFIACYIARSLHAHCTLIARSIARYENTGFSETHKEKKETVLFSFSYDVLKTLCFHSVLWSVL